MSSHILNYLLYGVLAAVAVTLILGVMNMFQDQGSHTHQQSNHLMRLRILLQAIALTVLALLLYTRH